MRRLLRLTALLLAFALPALLHAPMTVRADEAPTLTVFGAASLTDALDAAVAAYRDDHPGTVRLVFESSSTLARQIEQGAPADLYLSANPRWMDYVAERGLIDTESRRQLLANSLALIAPADREADSGAADDDILGDGDRLLAALGGDGRLAMGDPDHVPAGIYGRQALTSLGYWAAIEPRVARAANVRAALALVARGETPLGIVYATDAAAEDGVRTVAAFPASSHPPILYPAAITAHAAADPARAEATRRLLDFLAGDEATAIFARFGFSQPKDAAGS
ncbi:molybdate ABC transporter substrate-binding protein [Marivibrio halodurans]|uniref:Molybdate ABC transporter substrate-binding protein n=1 Tax=Marivibrio halodurans TaxID=2039722 RepID=A0A8J7RW04_9PROT|nr:molybdate ABC transporter substrate-binding protein [Marivibrio halodurans]MBP5855400.1 molybdate ABC transporter substrate-binding protein [Marivibrio halodurans]